MSEREESSTRLCQNPQCDDHATETYKDQAGNDLALCEACYFEAVHPSVPVRSIVKRDTTEVERGPIARRLFK